MFIEANWALDGLFLAGCTLNTDFRNAENQALLAEKFRGKLAWLRQIHSAIVLKDEEYQWDKINEADALISTQKNIIPVVLTADCLPIVFACEDRSAWAVAHAGWQGLYQNIIGRTLQKLGQKKIHIWIAPHIRQENYEVDSAFYQRFMTLSNEFKSAFFQNREEHYLANLTKIAQIQLRSHHNIVSVSDCGIDTFADQRFHSYRRDKEQSGRLATFILPKG